MITLKYCDWLALANISEELFEQILDMLDDHGVTEVETIRLLGISLQDGGQCHLTLVSKDPTVYTLLMDILKIHGIEDVERYRLIGDLLVAFANHEDGKIDG